MGESSRAIVERAIERSKCRDCTWNRPCAKHAEPGRTCSLCGAPVGARESHCATCRTEKCEGCGHRLARHVLYQGGGRNRHGSPLVCTADNCAGWTECRR